MARPGPVRDDSLQTDTVTLSAYIESGGSGRMRYVRIVLDDPEYHQLVSRACETRDLIEVSGDLQPSGPTLTLQAVTGLHVLGGETSA